ncbi:MAG: anaerobic ribonucleoside-triphosphate reductase [Eubacteriales bacterium]|nr:anaerobic ribonucleoside-triphosphate reductase [Eubacteriales bacterium]
MENKRETVGQGVKFERIRRITGYLVGTTDRFNNAKQAEEKDRVKHCITTAR